MVKNASKRIKDLETSIRPTKQAPVVVYWRSDLGYYRVDGPGVTSQLTIDQYMSLEKHNDIIACSNVC